MSSVAAPSGTNLNVQILSGLLVSSIYLLVGILTLPEQGGPQMTRGFNI